MVRKVTLSTEKGGQECRGLTIVCVCVCVCVCEREREREREFVCVCLCETVIDFFKNCMHPRFD